MLDEPDALQRCVGDTEVFAAQHWGRRPRLHRTDDSFADIFGVDDLDTVLVSAARRPEVRVVNDGRTLPASDYCRTVRLGGQVTDDVIDPGKLADRFAEGGTIVLQSLHRTHPMVGRFAAELEHITSHPVQVNAYLTPPGAAGLRPHSDGHDVIVRQIHGTKHWHVDGLGDLELTPGDTIYMPTGTEHSARTNDVASLHLTIGILRITYAAVVRRLVDTMDDLEAPLPLGWAHEGTELEPHLDAALRTAARAIDAADRTAVVERERARRRTRPDHRGRIAALVHGATVDLDTVVEIRPGAMPRLVEAASDGGPDADDRVRIVLADRSLTLPAVARTPLDKLLTGGPVRVGDLPGVDEESRVTLARRLVAEGMLAVRPPD